MSFLAKLAGGGISSVIDSVGAVVDDLQLSGEERMKLETEQYEAETDRIEVEQADRLAQIKVNQEEARHPSVFVSGWRPFVGWIAGVGFGIHVVLLPIALVVVSIWYPLVELPEFDTLLILTILSGVLGLNGAGRTMEKLKGVARHK